MIMFHPIPQQLPIKKSAPMTAPVPYSLRHPAPERRMNLSKVFHFASIQALNKEP